MVAAAHRPQTTRRAFSLGLLTGAVYFSGTLYWLVETMTRVGGPRTPPGGCGAALPLAHPALYPPARAASHARAAGGKGGAARPLCAARRGAAGDGRDHPGAR